jgi:hypothetical protein
MIKCTECGYENMDGLDYCDGCGAKLAAPESAGSAAPASAEVSERIVSNREARDSIVASPLAPAAGAVSSGPLPVVESAPSEPSGPSTDTAPAAGVIVAAAAPAASEAKTGEMTPPPEPIPAAAPTAAVGAHFKAKLSLLRQWPELHRTVGPRDRFLPGG